MRLTVNLVQPIVPDGWSVKHSTTLVAPTGEANIIASDEPVHPSVDTDRYAADQLGLLRREFPQFRELANGRLLLGDAVPAVWRHFRWQPPDGATITQMQLYAVVDGRGISATATASSSTWERYEAVFHDVMRGMLVTARGRS